MRRILCPPIPEALAAVYARIDGMWVVVWVSSQSRAYSLSLPIRTTRSLSLTEEGERYFEQARRLVAEIEEVEASLRRGEQQLSGWLRVAVSVAFGRLKLMPVVQSFLERHRDVKIELRLSDQFIDLIEQGIDVAVRTGDLPDSSLVARRVGTSHRLLLAHRRYLRGLPRGVKAPRVPDDLVHHNCIVYTELAMRNDWIFKAGPGAPDAEGSTRTVHVQGNLQTNSSEVMRASVLAGMRIGYSPEWLFDEEIASGEVQRLLPDWVGPVSPIHVVSPQQRKNSAKVKAFAEHVETALKK